MTIHATDIPVISFVGKSNSGKTTLVEKVIAALDKRGVAVATVKHHSHDFDIDIPGKDSWRHAQAGARVSMISSPNKLAVIRKVEEELPLEALKEEALRGGCDVLIAEGFKLQNAYKFELSRMERSMAPVCDEKEIVGLISDNDALLSEYAAKGIMTFGLNDVGEVVDFIETNYLRKRGA